MDWSRPSGPHGTRQPTGALGVNRPAFVAGAQIAAAVPAHRKPTSGGEQRLRCQISEYVTLDSHQLAKDVVATSIMPSGFSILVRSDESLEPVAGLGFQPGDRLTADEVRFASNRGTDSDSAEDGRLLEATGTTADQAERPALVQARKSVLQADVAAAFAVHVLDLIAKRAAIQDFPLIREQRYENVRFAG